MERSGPICVYLWLPGCIGIMQTVEEPVLTPDSAAGGHESLIRCENSRAPLEPRAKDVLPNRQLLEVMKLNKQHQIWNCFWGMRQVSKWRNETADFLPPFGEILPFLVLISPRCRRKKSSEEKHTNLVPISFLISAEMMYVTCNQPQQFHLSHYHGYCNFLRAR